MNLCLAFEATTTAFERKTGTGVYAEHLIRAYDEAFPDDRVYHSYQLKRYVMGHKFLMPKPAKGGRCVEFADQFLIRPKGLQIYHGLNTRLTNFAGVKKVATVHDLFSIFGRYSRESFRERQAKKLKGMIDAADLIIAPSAYTKAELEKFGVAPEKIRVVFEGVRREFLVSPNKDQSRLRVRSRWGNLDQFFLFVGTLEKRKNVLGLLKLFEEFKKKMEGPHKLVLVGGLGFGSDEITRAIESHPYKFEIVRPGFVTDEELRDLYTAAQAFCFLSWEEGFGLPILEAMACATPVLAAEASSLPEVCQGHGWIVNLENLPAQVRALEMIANHDEAVLRKMESGLEYARSMTWTKVAQETRQIYLDLLKASL